MPPEGGLGFCDGLASGDVGGIGGLPLSLPLGLHWWYHSLMTTHSAPAGQAWQLAPPFLPPHCSYSAHCTHTESV